MTDEINNFIKERQEAINRSLDMAEKLDIGPLDLTPERRIATLIALVEVLASAMTIQLHSYRDPPTPEPYPGARRDVAESSLRSVTLARESGLLGTRR